MLLVLVDIVRWTFVLLIRLGVVDDVIELLKAPPPL